MNARSLITSFAILACALVLVTGRVRLLPDLRAFGGVIASAQAPVPSTPQAWKIEPITTPAATDSGEAQLAASGDRAVLSWIEGEGPRAALKFAERSAAGWGEARTVVSGAQLMVNASDTPFVRLLKDGSLVAQWLVTHGDDPEAYDIRLATSKDGGKTWSKAVSPHHDTTASEHGFASLFEPPGGGYGLIWLDGRTVEKDGDMALRTTTFAMDGKQAAETVLDPLVCECCQTAAAVTADGPIVAYRDLSPQGFRDISVARLVAGRWTSSLVHNDGWKIDACPVNGPAIAASGRTVVVAWFTVQKGQGHAFAAFSTDAGRTFGAPVRLDDATALGRVQVALLADGSAAVSWIEFMDSRSQFKARRIGPGASRGPAALIAEGMGTQYPRLVRRADELVFAWSESSRGSTRVRTARARL